MVIDHALWSSWPYVTNLQVFSSHKKNYHIAEKDHMNSQGQFSHISVLLLHTDNIY